MNTEEAISTSGRTPHTAGEGQKSTAPMPHGHSKPKPGDVLVSRRTARADVFAISVLPTDAHMTSARFEEAMRQVHALACGLAVDGWYTCDHTHFLRVAEYRSAMP